MSGHWKPIYSRVVIVEKYFHGMIDIPGSSIKYISNYSHEERKNDNENLTRFVQVTVTNEIYILFQ
jgi:hypothetical protein